jgi:methyltransferase (TIGR00027 family)
MEKGKASYSAEIVASMRALEALRPPDERICFDPFARTFLRGRLRGLAKSSFWRRGILRYLEYRAPGMQAGIAARTRYIDDLVLQEVANGITQLVILGAGYDSRALRLEPLKNIRVFEVDFPDTQAHKLSKLAELQGLAMAHITHVPIDFNTQKLGEVLNKAGYAIDKKTLFIWEGVTMYLNAEAVDATLAFVATNTAMGSSIYFDYFMKSVMDGSCQLPESVALRKMSSFNSDGVERFTYTIDEKAIPQFLAQHGFRLVEEMRGETLHQRYFLGKNAKRYVHRVCGYVHAAIAH